MLVRSKKIHVRSEMLVENLLRTPSDVFSASVNLGHDQQRAARFQNAEDFRKSSASLAKTKCVSIAVTRSNVLLRRQA